MNLAGQNAFAECLPWQHDYRAGLEAAQLQRKLAFIWLFDADRAEVAEPFERDVLGHPDVLRRLRERYVPIRLPATVTLDADGEQVALLDHPAFAEMQHSLGIAILDLTDEGNPHFRHVVSVFPFVRRPMTADELLVMLDLPLGSLTQRTLTFAVRTHRDQPASASSHFSPVLAGETQSHAQHQANILLQGHHQWESRFHSINARLPSGLVTQEVCAESWPGQSLLDAAEECVDSWRQSSGHWEAVSRRHVLFAYDMKRGRNGVWYAAGIFARSH